MQIHGDTQTILAKDPNANPRSPPGSRDYMRSPPRKRQRRDDAPPPASEAEQPAGYAEEALEAEEEVDEADDEEWEDMPEIGTFVDVLKKPPLRDSDGNPILIVVDTTRVHYVAIRLCNCETTLPLHQQLLRMGWYPASLKKPRTVFTSHGLNDFLLANKTCHTATSSYYAKLKRTTSNAFPHLVPVCVLDHRRRSYLSMR